jgi:hypothetical protein
MTSNWVNTARALKALYDLSFSQEPFYVNSRVELRNGVRQSVAQFRAGLSEPLAERRPLIRRPFKIMLYVLLTLCLVCVLLTGH